MSNDFDRWGEHADDAAPPVYAGADERRRAPRWIGLLMIVMALGFTTGTVLLLLGDEGETPAPDAPPVTVAEGEEEQPPTEAPSPTATDIIISEPEPPTAEPTDDAPAPPPTSAELPTLSADVAAQLLARPVQAVAPPSALAAPGLDPFTIIPDRPRSDIIQYVVNEGDTIDTIARLFNLNTESIAWSNSREIIQRFLRPGDVLNIPPEDGVYVQATGSLRTFRDYAELYGVDDPFVILDSPFNPNLRDYGPDDIPPDGEPMFISGGESFEVVWPSAIEIIEDPTSETGGSSGRTGSGTGEDTVFRVTFQNGQLGSCPPQPADGGTVWQNPLAGSSYRFVRGFSGYHPGIDLAASPGTPVRAANGGRVIFSGWNDFGYGYMVALVHGPTMTVYAHMRSQPFVGCGQVVDSGQVIGEVGSTGNSSGPHLHFEVRSRQGNTYVPQVPSTVIDF